MLRVYAENSERVARFLVSVPAFQFLWSAHDEFLAPNRRCTLQPLEWVGSGGGLTLMHSPYCFGLVLPFAAVSLLTGQWMHPSGPPVQSQLRAHSPVINEALALLCWIELPVLRVNRLAGLTAFCLAER